MTRIFEVTLQVFEGTLHRIRPEITLRTYLTLFFPWSQLTVSIVKLLMNNQFTIENNKKIELIPKDLAHVQHCLFKLFFRREEVDQSRYEITNYINILL